MSINSRADLIQYALTKLGSPVIKIEVADQQIQDRLDEALQFFQDFHYDGTERIYLKHQIMGSTILVASVANFIVGELVQSLMGASFTIDSIDLTSSAIVTKAVYKGGMINGTFGPLETITGMKSGASTTVISKVVGDIENGSVQISDMVTGVIRAIPWWHVTNKSNYVFDPKY